MAPSIFTSAFLGLLALTSAQQIGKKENHPRLLTQKCTKKGGCVTQNTYVVSDALSHQLTTKAGKSCLNSTGGIDTSVCNSVESCGKKCYFQGIDYKANGVETAGDSLHLRQYLEVDGALKKVSPRLYLLDADRKNYVDMKLLNQELTFTVDMSNLPCGMNAALYLGEMDADGGRSKVNPAGATYGTGYCDAQCYVPTWLNGKLNTGGLGACCNEMDVWESNSRATGYTPHACGKEGFYGCSGDECAFEGVCDKYGCGFNPYALKAKKYYGLGEEFKVDSSVLLTVTTQFIAGADGKMNEIKRIYRQNGKVIQQARVKVDGKQYNSITPAFCNATTSWEDEGGLPAMGDALGRGMILTFSLWNDDGGFMNWLDSGDAGPCNATEGDPKIIQQIAPDTDVTFSAIKWGDIGSTTGGSGPKPYGG